MIIGKTTIDHIILQAVEKVTPGIIRWWMDVNQTPYTEECSVTEKATFRPANPTSRVHACLAC